MAETNWRNFKFETDNVNQNQTVISTAGNLVNSRGLTFTEYGNYGRIFRITYVETEQPLVRPAILSTRLFLPYNKTDTILDIKQRLSDWVNPCLGT